MFLELSVFAHLATSASPPLSPRPFTTQPTVVHLLRYFRLTRLRPGRTWR